MRPLQDARRIAKMIWPARGQYALGIASLGVVNLSDVIAPLFMALAIELTEASLTGGQPQTPAPLAMFGIEGASFSIGLAVAVFFALRLMASVFRYPMLMMIAVPSHALGQTIRRRIAGHLLQQSQSYYDGAKSGELMSTATADVKAVRMMLGPGVMVGSDTLMLVTMVLAVLAMLSWKLALITIIPIPLIYWTTNKLSHADYRGFQAVQDDLAMMTERTRESYAGIRIIQGYAQEEYDRDRFRKFSERHYRKNLRLARVRAVFDPTLDLFLGISTVLVLVFGGYGVVSGSITLGTFVAFLFLIRYLSGPMIGLGWAISLFQRGRASMDRIETLVSTPLAVLDAPNSVTAKGAGRIEIKDLTFSYGEAHGDALRDVSVVVEPGDTLGLFGPVGSGKSTLAGVLTRLYDPPAGSVYLDGVDVRDITLESLRRQIVVAPQETFLFSTTVARNIQLAGRDLAEPIETYAKLAHLQDEVDGFAEGYQTLLGERGVNLSGGQRQRLAIARAIAADPKILVLDDCLSAVDSATEEAILNNLRSVFRERSGIVISHRVRAVRACDQIIVLENGRVAERGTHEELVQNGGYYAQIAEEQMQEAL